MGASGVLAGKVAIVTGSTRGIGRATAQAFAEAGAKVTISSRKPEACEETCRVMREAGHEVLSVPGPRRQGGRHRSDRRRHDRGLRAARHRRLQRGGEPCVRHAAGGHRGHLGQDHGNEFDRRVADGEGGLAAYCGGRRRIYGAAVIDRKPGRHLHGRPLCDLEGRRKPPRQTAGGAMGSAKHPGQRDRPWHDAHGHDPQSQPRTRQTRGRTRAASPDGRARGTSPRSRCSSPPTRPGT